MTGHVTETQNRTSDQAKVSGRSLEQGQTSMEGKEKGNGEVGEYTRYCFYPKYAELHLWVLVGSEVSVQW